MTWGRDAILDAIAEWYDRRGRLPTFPEWERAEPGRPAARTVLRYGGWTALLAEAIGIQPEEVPHLQLTRPRRPWAGRWSREGMVWALVDHHRQHRRYPTGPEWERTTRQHPSRRSYVRVFGSWSQALEAARTVVTAPTASCTGCPSS